MNREPIRNRAVNAFAARQIHYRPPLTRVFAKAVSYLAAYIDNNPCLADCHRNVHMNVSKT